MYKYIYISCVTICVVSKNVDQMRIRKPSTNIMYINTCAYENSTCTFVTSLVTIVRDIKFAP